MKLCTKCKIEKPESDFGRRSDTGKIKSHCFECEKEYIRKHYENNKEKYLVKANVNRNKAYYRTREILWTYLLDHPCVDCGESDPIVLEFDHKDDTEKIMDVTKIIVYRNTKKLFDEIAKCDVRCANCHRRRTAKQFNNWKYARINPLASNQLKG